MKPALSNRNCKRIYKKDKNIFVLSVSITLAIAFAYAVNRLWYHGYDVAGALILVVAAVSAGIAVNRILYMMRMQSFHAFTHNMDTGDFQETRPHVFNPGCKVEKGILFIHGFSASPAEARLVAAIAEEEGYAFYAPVLTGFGIDNFDLLESVSERDWLRESIAAYDLLSQFCERVVVVGHSMGGVLAMLTALRRDPAQLIVTAPYLIEGRKHTLLRKLLTGYFPASFIKSFGFYIRKVSKRKYPVEDENPRFTFDQIPLNAVVSLWRLLDLLNPSDFRSRDVLALFGEKDSTSPANEIITILEEHGVSVHSQIFSESGHNILEDHDRFAVKEAIRSYLKSQV